MAVTKKKSTAANETNLRHVWLAGLGLLALTRREALATVRRAIGGVDALKQRAERTVTEAQANVRDGIETVRGQVEPKVAQFSAEVESRLAPVLVKLGLKPRVKAQRKTHKTTTKKAIRRTPARKPAKRATRKARS
ncbi:hypothetical protein [Lysobacter sp. CFH 32150]|uniref:phasin family protein n=1 Tax=Lysobacter sp. CFH 32150 TaxID=2927128 RepID=UPI001FA743FF|nr:hypothetical protein [Lysobacter sp. CFH 32150]MCI4566472.1 hypothetical protein [Lysobacter sp. CFH 32150]